jgi:hypothetical protein
MNNFMGGMRLDALGRISSPSFKLERKDYSGNSDDRDGIIIDVMDAAYSFEQTKATQYMIARDQFSIGRLSHYEAVIKARLNDGRILEERVYSLQTEHEDQFWMEEIYMYPILGMNLVREVVENRVKQSAAWPMGQVRTHMEIFINYMSEYWLNAINQTTDPEIKYQQELAVEALFTIFRPLLDLVDQFISGNPWLQYEVRTQARSVVIIRGEDYRIQEYYRMKNSQKD